MRRLILLSVLLTINSTIGVQARHGRLIWRGYSSPEDQAQKIPDHGDFLNRLFNSCLGPKCRMAVPRYEDSALPPPGPIMTGMFNADAVNVVAEPFNGLTMPDPVQPPLRYRPDQTPRIVNEPLAPKSYVVDASNLQRKYRPIFEKPAKQVVPVTMTYPKELMMKDSELRPILSKFPYPMSLMPEKEKIEPVDAEVDGYNLQRLYYLKHKKGPKNPPQMTLFPGGKKEYHIHSEGKPFNGFGDPRLSFLYNQPDGPKFKRLVVKTMSPSGKLSLAEKFVAGSEKNPVPDDTPFPIQFEAGSKLHSPQDY